MRRKTERDLRYASTRNRRIHAVRPRTIGVRELAAHRCVVALDEPVEDRPHTRAECLRGPRPCPWVGCRYHLYLDVNPRIGSLRLQFPDLEPDEIPASCALDIADRGPIGEDQIAPLLNCTRARVQQVCQQAFDRLQEHPAFFDLASERIPASKQVGKQEVARITPNSIPLPPHPGLAKCGTRKAA